MSEETIRRLVYVSNLIEKAVLVGIITMKEAEVILEHNSLDETMHFLERLLTSEISNTSFVTNVGVVQL